MGRLVRQAALAVLSIVAAVVADQSFIESLTIDACRDGTGFIPLPEDGSGLIGVTGAQQSLADAGRRLLGYSPTGSRKSQRGWVSDVLTPFTYMWSDVALTYYDSDLRRMSDNALHVVTSNTTERAWAGIEAQTNAAGHGASALLQFFGLHSDGSSLGTRAAVFFLDPFGLFRSSASELYSQVIEPVAHGASTVAEAAGVNVSELLEGLDVDGAIRMAQSAVSQAAAAATRSSSDKAPLPGRTRRPIGITAGVYAPHVTVHPFATTYVGFAPAADTSSGSGADEDGQKVNRRPAYVTCEVNPLALRFPAMMVVGLGLAHAAANPVVGTTVVYGSAAVLGLTFALLFLLQVMYRQRHNRAALFAAAAASIAGYFGQATGFKALLQGTPLEPIADYWPWLVVLFIVAVTVTTLICAQRALSDSKSWAIVAACLRVMSFLVIAKAFQHPAIGFPVAILIHGAGPICGVLEACETVVNFVLQWTLGWVVPMPTLAFIQWMRRACGCGRHKETNSGAEDNRPWDGGVSGSSWGSRSGYASSLRLSQGGDGSYGRTSGYGAQGDAGYGHNSGYTGPVYGVAPIVAGPGFEPVDGQDGAWDVGHSGVRRRRGSFAPHASGLGNSGAAQRVASEQATLTASGGRLFAQLPDGTMIPLNVPSSDVQQGQGSPQTQETAQGQGYRAEQPQQQPPAGRPSTGWWGGLGWGGAGAASAASGGQAGPGPDEARPYSGKGSAPPHLRKRSGSFSPHVGQRFDRAPMPVRVPHDQSGDYDMDVDGARQADCGQLSMRDL